MCKRGALHVMFPEEQTGITAVPLWTAMVTQCYAFFFIYHSGWEDLLLWVIHRNCTWSLYLLMWHISCHVTLLPQQKGDNQFCIPTSPSSLLSVDSLIYDRFYGCYLIFIFYYVAVLTISFFTNLFFNFIFLLRTISCYWVWPSQISSPLYLCFSPRHLTKSMFYHLLAKSRLVECPHISSASIAFNVL